MGESMNARSPNPTLVTLQLVIVLENILWTGNGECELEAYDVCEYYNIRIMYKNVQKWRDFSLSVYYININVY